MKKSVLYLSKRERQILDVLYRLGEASASEVVASFPDEAGDASIRKLMRVLEEKGYLAHARRGHEYVYRPTVAHKDASRSALRHVVETFFGGSAHKAVSALIDPSQRRLTDEERAQLEKLIGKAAGEGR
ncbi:MAG: BlaI/MecI/CopY family transcriptional regulator [Planctomycetes bacterium]|nr:BlaI/MecI/CopY family transcriptional regulator [Planctomycetota bacterium]